MDLNMTSRSRLSIQSANYSIKTLVRGSARSLIPIFLAMGSSVSLSQTASETYSSKPMHILVPFSPGGTADVLARIIGQQITETTGQAVIIENRAGAGGTIGMEAAKRSPTDGYNFVLISNSQAGSQVLYPKLSHDITRDFAPIDLIASSPMVIAANPALGVKTLNALFARTGSDAVKLSYASCGVGTAHHLAMEKIKFDTRKNIVHVSYRGCSPAVVDAIAGHIDLVIASAPLIIPQAISGKLVPLAVTNDRRSTLARDIPTVAESGVPALKTFSIDNWYGFMAPLGTPAEAINRLDLEVSKIMSNPAVIQRLALVGIEPKPGNAQQLMTLLKSDLVQFKAIVDHAHITAE